MSRWGIAITLHTSSHVQTPALPPFLYNGFLFVVGTRQPNPLTMPSDEDWLRATLKKRRLKPHLQTYGSASRKRARQHDDDNSEWLDQQRLPDTLASPQLSPASWSQHSGGRCIDSSVCETSVGNATSSTLDTRHSQQLEARKMLLPYMTALAHVEMHLRERDCSSDDGLAPCNAEVSLCAPSLYRTCCSMLHVCLFGYVNRDCCFDEVIATIVHAGVCLPYARRPTPKLKELCIHC